MRITVVGSIFGSSGYDNHTRHLANALYNIHRDVALEVPKGQGWEALVNDSELNMIQKKSGRDSAYIGITTPPHWKYILASRPKKFYGYVIWEGDKIPLGWVEHLFDKRVDGIIVPSTHVKDAISKTLNGFDNKKEIMNKIILVPHGVDTELFKPVMKKKNKNFTFFANKGWNKGWDDRGGIQFFIKAYAEEFTKKDKVSALIKLNPAYVTPDFDLKKEVEKLGIINENRAELKVVYDNIPYSKLPALYSSANVFVSPSMAEAFNIPCLEAMSCGLPVITTGFGGQTDFVNKSNGWFIKSELFNVDFDINYEGIKWVKPLVEHLRYLLRYAYNNRGTVISKGARARATAKKLSWSNSARIILKHIK